MTRQTSLPNKQGWLNRHTETWHYLRRCAGETVPSNRIRLPEAVEEGYNLCGNCCSRFYWYDHDP